MEPELNLPNEEVVRRYMLGQASDEESSALEERLMSDKAFYEELSVVEDELIDDFLAGALTADEREPFDNYFLASPERRRKLEFSRAFRKYVAREAFPNTAPQEDTIDPPRVEGAIPDGSSQHTKETLEFPSQPDSDPSERKQGNKATSEQSTTPIGMVRPIGAKAPLTSRIVQNPFFQAAAILVVVCGAAFGIWRIFFYQSDADRGIALFVGRYDGTRPIVARITALPKYGSTREERGGENDKTKDPKDVTPDLIRVLLRSNSDAKSQHALGEFYLTQKKFTEAIESLTKAADSDSGNAEYQSDLGAALLEQGTLDKERASSPTDRYAMLGAKELGESIAHLDNALRVNPNLLAALFDRALAYEQLSISSPATRDQAEAAWQQYLDKDPVHDSGWGKEAEERLRRLRNRPS